MKIVRIVHEIMFLFGKDVNSSGVCVLKKSVNDFCG